MIFEVNYIYWPKRSQSKQEPGLSCTGSRAWAYPAIRATNARCGNGLPIHSQRRPHPQYGNNWILSVRINFERKPLYQLAYRGELPFQ
jgi:hypothetical protein